VASAGRTKNAQRETADNDVSKASLREATTSVPPENRDKQDPLFIQGQRYLYGTGVRQNCDLATKSLSTAAQNSNTEAQSTLATMYATGHCVSRNLPMAYRWFAKASHQEPNNPRIQQDLEILWRQMTPEEKQVAINNR
jgi:TPR repeat protein